MTALLHINQLRIRKNIYKSALLSLYGKKKVWNTLQDERQLRQKVKDIESKRLENKKLYIIMKNRHYKLIGDGGDFYIHEEILKNIPKTKFSITLYKYSFSGIKEKSALIKIDKRTNKIFISVDTLYGYFKPYNLELKK